MKKKDLQKCPAINDPIDTYIWEPISFIFAKAMAKRHWSPNVATIFSLVCGVAGGVMFAFHNIWINVAGAVLFLLAIIFDCSDGQIARLNHCGSLEGRMFDGFCDGLVYFAAYVGLSVHCMFDKIPFTDTNWSWWIFLVSVPICAFFHSRQARVADYNKQVYMYIGGLHSELSNSKALEEECKDKKMGFIGKLSYKSYLSYTKQQEKESKGIQLLLGKIAENNGVIPEEVANEFKKHSLLFKLGNLETVNLRTIVLITLLLVSYAVPGLACWHFAFLVVVLEPINLILKTKTERLAKRCAKEYFK